MKAKKLPSGSWRAQVYSYTDANGKKHRESFTAPTKAEAEMKAAEYVARKDRRAKHNLTVGEAIDGYISAKEAVLSPSTVRGYIRMRGYYTEIEGKKIKQLSSEDLQIFISNLSRDKSPKTVKNAYGLLTASLSMYSPDMVFKVTLPSGKKKRPQSPSDDVVRYILDNATPYTRKHIALAMCALRRSEICALKYEDIVDGVAHIHAAMVQDKNDKWVYKEYPKTSDSDRFIKLPDPVIAMIGEGTGFIVTCAPDTLTKRFTMLRNKLGLDIRLHDLRHYFASTAAVLNIPDIYTEDMGGWQRGSQVMKKVYQNNIKPMSDIYNDKINDHISKILKEDA